MTRWRLLYRIGWDLAWVSHLDRWRSLSRTARRAHLPLSYSHGFHPRPRLAMGPPLPVGARGEEELADLFLDEPYDGDLCCELNSAASPGLEILRAWPVPLAEKALTAGFYLARWRVEGTWVSVPPLAVASVLLTAPSLPFHRVTPKGEKDIDLRRFLIDLAIVEEGFEASLRVTPDGGARLQEIAGLLEAHGFPLRVSGLHRLQLRPA